MDWHVTLLSTFSVQSAAGREVIRADKRSALMAYLAFKASWVSRDELGFLFWPDTDDRSARANLRQLLMRCKRLPYGETLETNAEAVYWPVETDLRAFNASIAAQDWFAALRHYRGHLLTSFYLKDDADGFSAWLELERDSLKLRWQDATFKAAEALSTTERSSEAAGLLLNVWQLDDYNERIVQAYLRHAYAAGQKAAALAAFATFAERLEKAFEIEVSAETQALIQAIQSDTLDVETPTSPATLQPQRKVAPLIGRHSDLEQLTEILSESGTRAVAMTGQGGVGKTRLALEVATQLHPQLEHGAHLVPLASIQQPEQVVSAIAAALSFSIYGPTDPQQQLVNYLRGKEMLLVMDNLEHVLEAASTLSELLEAAPHLKLLITSRQLPEISGLWHYPLTGLSYQTDDSDALTLFVQAAQSHQPRFVLDDANRADAQALCRLVEGLPLALELAAAWMGELSVADILSQIQRSLDFLQRDGKRHHDSMTAVISHSWQLLSPEQQRLLAGLSVFRGGFTREAAEAICGATPYLLLSLQNRSLISRDNGRYNLHELIRQYAAERLWQQTNAEVVREKHLRYYQTLALEAEDHLDGAEQIPWKERLRAEYQNYLAALEWGFGSRPTDAVILVAHLARYWQARGQLHDAARWLKQAIEQCVDTPIDVQAKLHNVYYYVVTGKGDFKEAEELEAVVLDICQKTGDANYEAEFCSRAGWTATTRMQLNKAQGYLERGLKLVQPNQISRVKNHLLMNMARLTAKQNNLTEAFHYQEACLNMSRLRQDSWLEMTSLSNIAWLHLLQKDYAQCVSFSEEALLIARKVGDVGTEAIILGNIGYATWQSGNHVKGEQVYRKHLLLLYSNGNIPYFVDNAFELAQFWNQLGFAEEAVCLWAAAEHLRMKLEHPVITNDYEEIKARVVNAVTEPQQEILIHKGQSLSSQELVRFIETAVIVLS